MTAPATPFGQLGQEARAWLAAPSEATLRSVCEGARAASALVPEARRRDWERLVVALACGGPAERQRARVQGLLRACRLFSPTRSRGDPAPARLHVHSSIDSLPGLGPAARDALALRGIVSVGDLVWTLPVAWDDLRSPMSIAEAVDAAARASAAGVPVERGCVRAIVKSASLVPIRGRRVVRVTYQDERDTTRLLYATWFFAAHGVLAAATPGKAVLLLGRVRLDPKGRAQVAHPDVVADEPTARAVRPRYARMGVSEAALRKGIAAALERLSDVPDPVPPNVVKREHFEECAPLLRAAHGTDGSLRESPSARVRMALVERLAWAEAFVRVWDRLSVERRRGLARSPHLPVNHTALARFQAELHFAFTGAQSRAIDAVSRDLASETPMRRLLLGDVGTGKTAVALAAAAQCVAAGWQVAILAPTSVLAEQYMDAVAPLARATAAPISLMVGGRTAKRQRMETLLTEGKIAVAIGTHALLGDDVRFARLGLVIVDEQHRLGVAQRLDLVKKGSHSGAWPHLLTLSATPIPRTMALALRGELATTVLDERPRGRNATPTILRHRSELGAVVEEVRAACAGGGRVFWVCPRIEDGPARSSSSYVQDDDVDDEPGAGVRAAELAQALAPLSVALIHGGMRAELKSRAMRAFRTGRAQVLVGTTVIEVGVDVPEATLMVIESAERFGLAQLHQLRGRVGRGDSPGHCILLHDLPGAPSDTTALARRRLEALSTLTTGTEVARADLELRGAGDLGGTRQSGEQAGLMYLDVASPPAWLERLEADAREIIARDPSLEDKDHIGLALFVRRLAASVAVRDEAG